MPELFDKSGGFRKLHSFTLATIVQLETLRFCRRFLTHDPREAGAKLFDPKGRQYDQMTQAGRSLSLLMEAFDEPRILAERGPDHLQRDEPVESPLLGLENDAHTPAPKLRDDLVTA